MKIYINGDSHAAAAEAVNSFAFAEDDNQYFYMGRAPHPANAAVSWGRKLGNIVKASVHNDAESASSNDRILRTSRAWLANNHAWLAETVVLIQWSTWERTEWLINGTYYQINASGIDQVPENYQEQYKAWVSQIDWDECLQLAHKSIWQLHQELQDLKVRHVFFNGNNDFSKLPKSHRYDWQHTYVSPYDPAMTYDALLKSHGHQTVSAKSWHFGPDAHSTWANFVLQFGIDHQLWV